jgi:hypothetical protein
VSRWDSCRLQQTVERIGATGFVGAYLSGVKLFNFTAGRSIDPACAGIVQIVAQVGTQQHEAIFRP